MAIKKKNDDDQRINDQIRVPSVRLISADKEQLGIVTISEALDIAKNSGLDLVEVSPNSDPPVCRIMDYGKYKYQESKKDHEIRKRARTSQLKEVKLRPHTEDHDVAFKVNSIRKFIEKNARVKVTVFFRGREMAYMEAGNEILEKVAEQVADIGSIEQPPTREARNRMSMVLVPLKN